MTAAVVQGHVVMVDSMVMVLVEETARAKREAGRSTVEKNIFAGDLGRILQWKSYFGTWSIEEKDGDGYI